MTCTNDQGRLSIIGPQAKQCTGAPTYTTTHRNKMYIVDKIKHTSIFIILVNQCLNIKIHAVYNIQRSGWGPYACGAPGQLPSVPICTADDHNLHMQSSIFKKILCTSITTYRSSNAYR